MARRYSIAVRWLAVIALICSSEVVGGAARPEAVMQAPPNNIAMPGYWEDLTTAARATFFNGIVSAQGVQPYSAQIQTTPCVATVTLTPMPGSHLVDQTAVESNPAGFVVAKITNTSSNVCPIKKFGIHSGQTVYWVVRFEKTGSTHTLTSHFVDANEDVGATIKRTFTLAACVTQHTQPSGDVAVVWDKRAGCIIGLDPKLSPQQARSKALGAGLHMTSILDDEDLTFWFACSQTCCYADG